MLFSSKVLADSSVAHGKSSLQRVVYLDGWRGLAIVFLLQEHFFGIPHLNTGRLGVDIFFCLSGMLMSHILFVKGSPLAIFYKRRISRILPAFLIFVLVMYSLGLYLEKSITRLELFTTLTFMRTYIPAVPNIWDATIPIGHLWSLNVEEHSYVLLSLLTLAVFIRRHVAVILITTGIVSVVIHILYEVHPYFNTTIVNPEIRTETSVATIMLSGGYYLLKDRFVHYVRPWMPVTTFFITLLCYLNFPWWASELIPPFLLAFTVNHLSEAPKLIHSFLSAPQLRLFGIWSYSIYLWQQPFYINKTYFFPGAGFLLAILTGILSFYLLENPIRSWLNRRW